ITELEAEAFLRDAIEDLFRSELRHEILKGITKGFGELRKSGTKKRAVRALNAMIDQALEVAAEQLVGDDKEAAGQAKEAAIDLLLARAYLRKIGSSPPK